MREPGFSLAETMIALGLFVILAALGASSLVHARDYARAAGAADHLASLLQLARLEAVKRHVHVALRFETAGGESRYVTYADGNGNGVRAADIADGVDKPIRPSEQLGQHYPGVGFGLAPDVPAVDGDEAGEGDGVRVGRSRMVSYSPLGTSTSGTVYLLGRGRQQFAVRVLGPTGRVRSFEFGFADEVWRPR